MSKRKVDQANVTSLVRKGLPNVVIAARCGVTAGGILPYIKRAKEVVLAEQYRSAKTAFEAEVYDLFHLARLDSCEITKSLQGAYGDITEAQVCAALHRARDIARKERT